MRAGLDDVEEQVHGASDTHDTEMDAYKEAKDAADAAGKEADKQDGIINTLEPQISTLSETISSLQGALASLPPNRAKIEAAIKKLEAQKETLNSQLEDAKTARKKAKEDELTNLKDALTHLENAIDANTDLEELRREQTRLNNEINRVQQDIDRINQQNQQTETGPTNLNPNTVPEVQVEQPNAVDPNLKQASRLQGFALGKYQAALTFKGLAEEFKDNRQMAMQFANLAQEAADSSKQNANQAQILATQETNEMKKIKLQTAADAARDAANRAQKEANEALKIVGLDLKGEPFPEVTKPTDGIKSPERIQDTSIAQGAPGAAASGDAISGGTPLESDVNAWKQGLSTSTF